MIDAIAWVGRWYIAVTFATAAVGKADTAQLGETLRAMGLPAVTTRPLARLLAAIEAALALATCFAPALSIVAPVTACLVLLFMLAGILARKKSIECACFGPLTSDRLGWSTVWRNLPLLLAAVLVWLFRPGAGGIGFVAIGLLTAAGLFLTLQMGRHLVGRA